MSKASMLLLILICSAVAGVTGALSGYYAAVSTPVASPIAVIDIEAMANGIDTKSPDYMRRMQEVSAQAKVLTQRLTANGVIVLDRAAVIGAPDESIVRVDASRK